MKKKKQKQRVYRLSDLKAIAEQLGGRIQLQVIPKEIIAKLAPETPPSKDAK